MGKRDVVGTCHLCHETSMLSRSHILPEFMHGKAADERGTFISITADPLHRPRPAQTGAWAHLLCGACEGRLSVFETYAAGLLNEIDQIPDRGEEIVSLNYDYARFKLFGLSLIWRAHISTRAEHQRFSVGPLAEDIRLMLLAEDPGPARMCPFVPIRFLGSVTAQQTVTTPTRIRLDGQWAALFDAYGYRWFFVTSRRSHTIPDFMPMVGFSPMLQIPSERTSDRQFQKWIRSKLPPHIFK